VLRPFATLVLALALSAPAAAQPGGYPTDDLLTSLRPAERATVLRDAQLASADALPLYELTLELADDLRSFELDETVTFTNPVGRPLADVVFRIFANAVVPPGERPLVELIEGECLDGVSCATTQTSPSALVVRPSQPLAVGARIRVRLRLRGRLLEIAPDRASLGGQAMESLSTLLGGHRHGDYGLLAHSDGVASMSFFFPVLARLRGGRWEERDASTMGDLGTDELVHVRARVRVPDGTRVAASGVVSAPRALGNRVEHVVSAGFVREWAMVASPRFVSRERTVGDVVVRSWFVDRDAQAGEQVLDVAARSLALFVDRFGPYPYTELDVVQAPLVGGAGGMEQSGLVTVATMLYRPTQGGGLAALAQLGGPGQDVDARRRAMLEMVTAHEVAHQWWHGIVGSDSRRHPFQDETLAQYSAMLYFAERYGTERGRREAEQQVAAGYHAMRMMGRPDVAVDQPVSAFADPLTYGGIVYGKGPYLYPALRSRVGDRAFFRALREHVAAHRFRMAPPRALFDRMARGPRAAAVRALVRRWLDETHGDADLGQPDLGRMLGLSSSDPTLQMLRALVRQLGQGGPARVPGQAPGSTPSAPAPPGSAPPGSAPPGEAPSGAELEGLMRGLMQMLEQAGP
jgi:hypothetical protein